MAKYKKLPSIIFDEIDKGFVVKLRARGFIMKDLGEKIQTFSITHLAPQIAAMGESHFKIYKSVLMVLQKL